MPNKQDYLSQVQIEVSRMHNCGAVHVTTIPVRETIQGATVWQGEVEVFDLHKHPRATRAYAWTHQDDEDEKRARIVAVLEIPPVESAETAVRIHFVKHLKNRNGRSCTP
jgi:hypothetical protein